MDNRTITIDYTKYLTEFFNDAVEDIEIHPISEDTGTKIPIYPNIPDHQLFGFADIDYWDTEGIAYPIYIKDGKEYVMDIELSICNKAIYFKKYHMYIPYTKAMELIPELSRTHCMWHQRE